MNCAVHAERSATHSIGDTAACGDCAAAAVRRARAFAPTLPIVVSIAYLLVLALGVLALRGRPIVGGLAAVAALLVGRALQIVILRPVTPLSASSEP